jgi:hypothetical protein
MGNCMKATSRVDHSMNTGAGCECHTYCSYSLLRCSNFDLYILVSSYWCSVFGYFLGVLSVFWLLVVVVCVFGLGRIEMDVLPL